MSRVLAIHRANAHILHLSAAGRYIDNKILEDMEQQTTYTSRGSIELGRLVLQVRIDNWLAV